MKLISLKGKFYRLVYATLLILVCLSFIGCNNINNVTAKIDSLEWRAIADIREWKTCDESGWEVPEGAIVYKEQEGIKSYKITGYETRYRDEEYQEVVGYYRPTWRPRYETRTREVPYQKVIKEPVYATKYYYTIDKWVHKKYVQLACGYDHNYNYPDYVCDENERVYNVEYKYFVKFENESIHIFHPVDKATWEVLQVGQEISVKKDQYGIIHVDWDNMNNTNE